MKKRIAIDLEGTLIDNARSIELQERVKTSGDDWYLVTAHADPLAVEDIVREETALDPETDFVEIICTSQKAKACFEHGITRLIDDSVRYRKSCEKYGVEFELV
ncbi:hypothetical protein [Terasakiella pusilla]|uniref:hypothetical protein n=1 Tax=Terasakiella pusilla TaxID=64973 RepID=UPI00048F4B4C|nr:hypothetical protein [Terasakiella pusilla]